MMNWNAIGAVGEIVGALAVVFTLIYLARQISQNTGVSSAEQNRAVMESYADFNNVILANAEVAELLVKLEEPEVNDLTPRERVQIRHLVYRLMNAWYTMHSSYASNQLSPEDYGNYKDDIRVLTEIYPGLLPAAVEVMSRFEGMIDIEIHAPFAEYAKRNG
jgi:hypothetical protein